MANATLRFFGKFEIEALLGCSAATSVYRALDWEFNRPVVVKVLRAERLVESERAARRLQFDREARIGRSLSHPNILHVYEEGTVDGKPFLSMEPVNGRPLSHYVERSPLLGIEVAVHIIVQVLAALDHAHGRGIVHRDVKPGNIFFCQDGTIRLADFGNAFERGPAAAASIEPGIGTLGFLAPEQLRGDPVDVRTDVFSVGAVLYYLCTGKRPFTGLVPEVINQVLTLDPPLPSRVNPRVPADLDPIIMQALAKNPAERHANARDFALLLRRAAHYASGPGGERDLGFVAPVRPPQTLLGPAHSEAELVVECRSYTQALEQVIRGVHDRPLNEGTFGAVEEWLERWTWCRQHLEGLDPPRSTQVAAALTRELVELCRGVRTAHLVDCILSYAPHPALERTGGRRDWFALIRLFRLLHKTAARLAGPDPRDELRRALAKALGDEVVGYCNQMHQQLLNDDSPDLIRISGGFPRVEQIRRALEELKAEDELRQVRHAMLVLASGVMAKASAVIRDMPALSMVGSGAAGVLAETEELIVMAARLLRDQDGLPLRPRDKDPFHAVGRRAVLDVIADARVLADRIADDLIASTGPDLGVDSGTPAAEFADRLRQLASLCRFASRLPADTCRDQLDNLISHVRDRIDLLLDRMLHHSLDGAEMEPPGIDPGDPMPARLTALYEVAEELRWNALRQRIIERLRL